MQHGDVAVEEALLRVGVALGGIAAGGGQLVEQSHGLLALGRVDGGRGAVVEVTALLPHQAQEEAGAHAELEPVVAEVLLAGGVLELLALGQQLIRTRGHDGVAVVTDEAGLCHEVDVHVPQAGVDVERQGVDLAVLGGGVLGRRGVVAEVDAGLGQGVAESASAALGRRSRAGDAGA